MGAARSWSCCLLLAVGRRLFVAFEVEADFDESLESMEVLPDASQGSLIALWRLLSCEREET